MGGRGVYDVGSVLILIAAHLGSPVASKAQQEEHDSDWWPDRSRLITMSSGHPAGDLSVRIDLTGTWTPFVTDHLLLKEGVTFRPAVTVAFANLVAFHGGYFPERMELADRVWQKGQMFGGVELFLPWGSRTAALGAQFTHPWGNETGRSLSESIVYGMAHWEGEPSNYTLGLAVRGSPYGEGSSNWDSNWYLLVGMQRTLASNLEFVGEGFLGAGMLNVRPGLRTGTRGLSVEASIGCIMGNAFIGSVGLDCVGPAFTGSYSIRRR